MGATAFLPSIQHPRMVALAIRGIQLVAPTDEVVIAAGLAWEQGEVS